MSVVDKPRSEPITDPETLRRANIGVLRVLSSSSVVTPLTAYQLAFLRRPDAAVVDKVRRQLRSASAWRPGYIYAFWDRRDPPTTVKVGRTAQATRRRLVQWDRVLGNADSVVLLFAFYTADNQFAEALVQNLLFAEWLPKRVNRLTSRRVVEYYHIENAFDLKILLILIARYVDALVRKRGQTSPRHVRGLSRGHPSSR